MTKGLGRAYLEGREFVRPRLRYAGTPDFHLLYEKTPQGVARQKLGLFTTWKHLTLKRKGYRIMHHRHRQKISKSAFIRHRKQHQKKAVADAREIQRLALANSASAMRVAIEVMENKRNKGSERLAAVEIVLNRAAGRPTQTNINASIDANAPAHEASDTELNKRIDTALKRVEELTGRTPKARPRQKRSTNIRVDNRDPGGTKLH